MYSRFPIRLPLRMDQWSGGDRCAVLASSRIGTVARTLRTLTVPANCGKTVLLARRSFRLHRSGLGAQSLRALTWRANRSKRALHSSVNGSPEGRYRVSKVSAIHRQPGLLPFHFPECDSVEMEVRVRASVEQEN